MENKIYVKCSISENPHIFKGYYESYSIEEKILERLSKDIGFSYDMYTTLAALDPVTAEKLVTSMSKKNNIDEIYLLLDSEKNEVLGYSIDPSRAPLLNPEFIKRVKSLVETSNDIEISEVYHSAEDTIASVIIKKVDPITLDSGTSQTSYDIGILVVNNELENTYCRIVVYIDNQPIYLPASYYNASSSRFKRSTGTSEEALEVLILKVINELREDELKYKIQDFHLKYKVNVDILATYEEYNRLMRTMMRIPSIADDRSFLESITNKYEDFEKKYANLEDQKSSYIWRCTAMGDLTIGALSHLTCIILNELNAPSLEYFQIRELLGDYLSTSRIAVEIAKES